MTRRSSDPVSERADPEILLRAWEAQAQRTEQARSKLRRDAGRAEALAGAESRELVLPVRLG